MEVKVVQRSQEWFEFRKCVPLTASKFGDAIGVGRGKPYDFLVALLNNTFNEDLSDEQQDILDYGTDMEPIISEAYELLTGHKTKSSGFWLPEDDDILHKLVGVSPDAKVYSALSLKDNKCIGLAEYKAPIHCLYKTDKLNPHGIPRQYMAQIQGQMGVCKMSWCDFMAICKKSKQIMLKRVYFSPTYWFAVSSKLRKFCLLLKEAKERLASGHPPLEFPAAQILRSQPMMKGLFPGESTIIVEDLLEEDRHLRYRTNFRMWMSFDFLVGEKYEYPGEDVTQKSKCIDLS